MYAIDRKHKKIIQNDEFQHHGILGQKWGVITRHVGVNYIPVGERNGGNNTFKNARTYNMDSWGKSPSTNVLYITGYSGSGKSSLALKMKSNKDDVIHLDSYFDNPDGPRNANFNKYLNEHLPEYVKLSWPKDMISWNEWGRIVSDFEEEIENFGKSEFGNGRRVICEGVQLLDETIRSDKSFFKDKPTVIMSTSAIKSAYRSANRDGMKLGVDLIKQDVPNYLSWRKNLKNMNKALN